MQDILKLTTADELQEWIDRGLTESDIPADPTTGNARVALMGGFERINFNTNELGIWVVIYNMDADGKPINGRLSKADGNIYPKEVIIEANNLNYVSLPSMTVIPVLNEDQQAGIGYGSTFMKEFDAYFAAAVSGPIQLFTLIRNAIKTSSKIV